MSSNFTLTGTQELQNIFRNFPEGAYRKPLNAAFRKAALPVKQAMIRNIPPNLSGLKKAILAQTSRPSKGEPSLAVGVFNKGMYRNKRGINWKPWVIALWSNYGTLDWRANSFHNFSTPVRRKTSKGSMAGIQPKLFIERGWDQSKDNAQKTFEDTMDQEITRFFKKEAAK
jgi:hypothetical protein